MTVKRPEQSWPSMNVEWYEYGRDYPVELEAKARAILESQPGFRRVSEGLLFDTHCTWHSGGLQRWHCIVKFDLKSDPLGIWEI
jgi:hypothetical protein